MEKPTIRQLLAILISGAAKLPKGYYLFYCNIHGYVKDVVHTNGLRCPLCYTEWLEESKQK